MGRPSQNAPADAEDGIRVKRTPRRALVQTTDSQHQHPVADNRLNRNFTVTKPNTVWAADITYVQTNAGYVTWRW
ncbi:MAG: hypothetical protein HRU79_09055 [Ignavibacteria bacterium]|nr:MAG: hypothetical protein HRU79_09055 [Ignavibacteria bacterium]